MSKFKVSGVGGSGGVGLFSKLLYFVSGCLLLGSLSKTVF